MPNYQNGKIYKIVSNHTDKKYIGSTTQSLSVRLASHKRDFKQDRNCSSRKLFELGNVEIILIEKCPCEDRMELHKRERFHIENNDCVNKHIPSRTSKEYYQQNKEIIKKRNNNYYHNNHEICSDRGKNYRENNKEKIRQRKLIKIDCPICGTNVTKEHIRRHQRSERCLSHA